MAIVQSGNDAFASLACRVSGKQNLKALALQTVAGDQWQLTHVIIKNGVVVGNHEQLPSCSGRQATDWIADMNPKPDICLEHTSKAGSDNSFGWRVVDHKTLLPTGQSTQYNGVL